MRFGKIYSWFGLRGLGGVLVLLSIATQSLANSLTDVSYATVPGNKISITLTTSEPVGAPTSFSTDNPARIAIDLPDTSVALAQRSIAIGSGMVRNVTAVESGGRTRVVVSLLQSMPYEVQAEGNKIVVSMSAGAATIESASGSTGSATAAAGGRAISSVDFRRGPDGEARVEIGLSDPSTVVDFRQQGTALVIDFMDTTLPKDLANTLDVTDFATPAQTVVARPNGRNVRVTVQTAGDYDHLAYQANDLYTIELKPVSKAEQEERLRREPAYTGERLSLNFQDIEVRSVLQLLADFTGLNLVVSDSVSGNLTLRLKNVPWDQALDIILKTKGLAMRRNDNVILIAPTEEIAAREQLELEAQQQIEVLAPLRSELVQVNYAKAEDLAELLKSPENRLLSERGNVTVDSRTNTLLVQDTANKLDEIRALLLKLDVPVRQVLVESRVVIASDDFARDLGVRFGFTRNFTSGDSFGLIGGGQPGHLGNSSGIVPGIDYPPAEGDLENVEALMVNLPKVLGGERGGGFNFLIGKLGSYLLQLELSAMQQEGKGEIVSSPRVITSDSHKAVIKQGVEIPYQEATSSGATNVEFKEAVLKLEVTPHITPDDRVIMELLVNKDNADFSRSIQGVPPVDTRQLATTVLVDNGETVVLGGVFERTRTESQEKIPFFGDLPGLGWMFKQELKSDQNTELLIFVTPKILKESLTIR